MQTDRRSSVVAGACSALRVHSLAPIGARACGLNITHHHPSSHARSPTSRTANPPYPPPPDRTSAAAPTAIMSQVHALSDDQVAGELKKMTAFIRQEAMEKAHEIRIKADEEFAIEKSKLVRQETAAIDSSYEKKFKQASMSQQITRSTVANKSRLRILSARQELLDRLFEDAQKKLATVSKDKGKYQGVLKNLILEGAYALNEDKIQVKARKADYDVVKKAIEGAQSEYKSKVNKEVSITIDEKDPLPEGSAGGVSIVGTGGRIDINNSFEERLRLLETDALPSIRVTLFGENKNRRFTD